MNVAKVLCWGAMLVLVAGCASSGGDSRKLQQTLYAYQSAVRWSDFTAAAGFIDPDKREDLALKDLEARRWEQYQVTGYYVQGSETGEDEVNQVVELRLINKHTQVERSLIDRQRWRWDSEAKAWWLTTPLPDLSR